MAKTTIAIDAMGGDNAPKAVIMGLERSFVRHPEVHFTIFGDEAKITPLVEKRRELKSICSIINVKDWIKDDEKASKVIKRSKTTSMGKAIECVASGNADAIVSGGNSGALMALSIFGLK